ncbi:MAG: hypothetical protein QCI38_07610 [Candidatus Thermoplasmatota archaeon]|nr:hypothetical protein [Candidatus Thermoplasmatota archaeon]
MERMEREPAWRIFAREFSDATVSIQGTEEKSPHYLLTPTGAKVNRVLAMGVLVDMENRGTDEDPIWWARVNDPTGLFFVFAGQYQPEASMVLSTLKPPVFVAVTGKTRVYSPESSDKVYTSIKADSVSVITEESKDYWVLEASASLRERLEALNLARKMEEPSVEDLIKAGVRRSLAEGIITAMDRYGSINTKRYREMLVAGLQSLLPEYEGVTPAFTPSSSSGAQSAPASQAEDNPLEGEVLTIVEELDQSPQGAVWEEVVDAAMGRGITLEDLEETVNMLIDKGDLYEPVLGRIKKV